MAVLALLLGEDPADDDPDAADRDSEGKQRTSRGTERRNEHVHDIRERLGRIVRCAHREEDEDTEARPEEALGRSHEEVEPVVADTITILRQLRHVVLPRSWPVYVR